MTEITSVDAWEVLDSRGDPTVRVEVTADGATGRFTVPSGASTGEHEAVERRDGGERFGGRGVREAVDAVEDELQPVVVGRDPTDQRAIDAALVNRDGTDDLSRLGANAVLGVSGAVAHAAAAARGIDLYDYFADAFGVEQGRRIPLPLTNVLSGGLHATGGIEIQDFLVVPVGAGTYRAALETIWEVRSAVRDRIEDRGDRPLVADEGGFAPSLDDVDDAFELLSAGVRDAGLDPGSDVAFAVDVAATHFHCGDEYVLESLDRRLSREEMIDLVVEWCERYPVVAVEDPLSEDDWTGWCELVDRIPDGVQVVGDDLIATSMDRLTRAIDQRAATGVLVKPNQAGTLTRTVDVLLQGRDADVTPIVSARSGETCDAAIADLSVGLGVGQIKIGSLARSERLAKYNRLLEIDRSVDRFQIER